MITACLIYQELLGLDVLHKFMWAKLITRMFEAMTGNFAYSGDIHLFLNVLSGKLKNIVINIFNFGGNNSLHNR